MSGGKKSTKVEANIFAKASTKISTGVNYFLQFLMEELMKNEILSLNIGDLKTFLSDKTFDVESKKSYELISPKFTNFIRVYLEAAKPDFDANKFDSSYAKFLQNVVNKQTNVGLFNLYKTSENPTIRSINTHVSDSASMIYTDSAGDKAEYVKFVELIYVGFAILIYKSSFITGTTLKDEQQFRRLIAGEFSEGSFKFGATDDVEFLITVQGLVTKTFEQQKTVNKKGANKKQEGNVTTDKSDKDKSEVDDLLSSL